MIATSQDTASLEVSLLTDCHHEHAHCWEWRGKCHDVTRTGNAKIFGAQKIFGQLKNIWSAVWCLYRECLPATARRRETGGDWSEQETEGRLGTRGNIVITERILGVQGDLWRNNWFWWFTMRMLSNYIFRVLGLCIEIFAAKNKRRSCKIVDIYLIKT